MTKRGKSARTMGPVSHHSSSYSLLELPMGVLHRVLGMLGRKDLTQLLHTSKAMAQEVMRHREGRLTLYVNLYKKASVVAIKHLLQWAPPSSLRVALRGLPPGCMGTARAGFSKLSQLFDVPCSALPAADSHHMRVHQSQQLPCILEVWLQGFTLPSLVPAGLAASCPNLHALRLSGCMVQNGSQNRCSSSSSRAGNQRATSSSTSSVWPANRIHTLVLDSSNVPCLDDYLTGSVRMTRRRQQALQYAEQLRSSLPNLTCLRVMFCPVAAQLTAIFASQLTELCLPELTTIPHVQRQHLAMHLQQLQVLKSPATDIEDESQMEQLLSLPSLTHLQINTVSEDLNDYSNHPCKWQYLHLHLHEVVLNPETLAKLPLHALTQPLQLGLEHDDSLAVRLPLSDEDDVHHRMQRLAQQLTGCGVQVVTKSIVWQPNSPSPVTQGAKLVPAFMAIALVFGQQTHVTLQYIKPDQPIMQAVATVYGPSVKKLAFTNCIFKADMQGVWPAAVQGLPAMERVDLTVCFYDSFLTNEESIMKSLVGPLAAAMAEQPSGRCIKVVMSRDVPFFMVQDLAEAELEGVEVTAVYDSDEESDDSRCLRIASKPRP